jgi:hypothetical protein
MELRDIFNRKKRIEIITHLFVIGKKVNGVTRIDGGVAHR